MKQLWMLRTAKKLERKLSHLLNYTKPKRNYYWILQGLTSVVNWMIPNPETRQIVIKPLAFENANSECKGWLGL